MNTDRDIFNGLQRPAKHYIVVWAIERANFSYIQTEHISFEIWQIWVSILDLSLSNHMKLSIFIYKMKRILPSPKETVNTKEGRFFNQ